MVIVVYEENSLQSGKKDFSPKLGRFKSSSPNVRNGIQFGTFNPEAFSKALMQMFLVELIDQLFGFYFVKSSCWKKLKIRTNVCNKIVLRGKVMKNVDCFKTWLGLFQITPFTMYESLLFEVF